MADTPKLLATVALQRLDARSDNFETIGEVTIDVTDLLAKSAEEVREAIRNFDGNQAPYLERVGTRESDALSAAHGGPTEVSLDIAGFLDQLELLPDDATAGNVDWLTDDMLERARAAVGIETGIPVAGEGLVFEIEEEHVLVVHDGASWMRRGAFGSKADAQDALQALGSAPGPR